MISNLSKYELGWLVGFLEGEGSFLYTSNSIRISVSQKQLEPLERITSMVEGRTYNTKHGNIYYWCLYGEKAVALMYIVYSFMSPRRKGQIKDAVSKWKARNGSIYRKFCGRGHPRTEDNAYYSKSNGKKVRRCKICLKIDYVNDQQRRRVKVNTHVNTSRFFRREISAI